MKWASLSKTKKVLIGTGLAVTVTAGVFAAYILKGNVNLISQGSLDAEAFPVNIDLDTPDENIGSIKPFLSIAERADSSGTRPAVKRTSKTASENSSRAGSASVLLADKSGDILGNSGNIQPKASEMAEGYVEPLGDGSPGSQKENQRISTFLASYPTHIGDFQVSGGNMSVSASNGRGASAEGSEGSRETNGGHGTSPVPEPSTMVLLGTGLVGLAAYGKKKIKQNRF